MNTLSFSDPQDWLKKRQNGVKRSYFIPEGFHGAVAVDIGANVGAFSLVHSNRFDRIISIEPAMETYHRCLKNGCEAYRYAVYKQSGRLLKLRKFKDEEQLSGNASTLETYHYDDSEYEEVPSLSLEDIFTQFSIKHIDYLKIDCEGAEYDFLMNKNLENISYISIELHCHLLKKRDELKAHIEKFFSPIYSLGSGPHEHWEITYKRRG